jgi:hypothetical protein
MTGHDSPEAAALASYPASAGAHVVRIELIDDSHVEVIIDMKPSHPMRVHCTHREGHWYDDGDIVE